MTQPELNILPSEVAERAASTLATLRENYLADSRAWVVAYSGGKDSTLLLQLVYTMLIDLGKSAEKEVYVISSDTQVEAPRIASHLHQTLSAISNDSKKRGLPLRCRLVCPRVDESFWAKLIGKGYPPPTRNFRWCTNNMKIKPARRSIADIAARHGSVVLLLGSRLSESSARRQRMEGRNQNFRGMNPHHDIPNAFVFTPIADWEIEEVWEYLLRGPQPPWGGDHNNLAELYRDASGGECPLVLDLTTPSCGGSRFGCWTCTVVKQDRSLQGFVDSGDDTLLPLVEYCQWLREIREDESRRLRHRRNGAPGPGPFDGRTRRELLQRLLEVEQRVGRLLVDDEVIKYIQSVWSKEIDLTESAIAIANTFGRELVAERSDMALNNEQRELLAEAAKEEGIDLILLNRLLSLADEFPDITVWGVKPQLRAKIKDIIEAAAGDDNGDDII